MELRFYIDPETELPHIYEHGVTEAEVHQILAKPGETRKGDGDSWVRSGQTWAGRYMKVVYVPDEIGEGILSSLHMKCAVKRGGLFAGDKGEKDDEKEKDQTKVPARME